MTTSFKTCLTPEEHIHRYGTLAPEQAAEFMESLVDRGTAREVSDLLNRLDVPDADEFYKLLVDLDLALPTDDLVAELRTILEHSFEPEDKVMQLLDQIEEDQASSASAVRRTKTDIESLQAAADKFSVELEQTLKTVNDKLGV